MVRSCGFIATPPGATIKEQLNDRGMSQKEFAARMDMSEKHISRLISGDLYLEMKRGLCVLTNEDKYVARILFKNKVLEYKGQTFEDFFVSVMTKAEPGFQAVKSYGNIGDRKNDGFIRTTGTYYQVYAPDDISKEKTIGDAVKKLENDFKGLYQNWNDTCKIKKYYFVVNDRYEGLPAPIIQKACELNSDPLYSDIEILTFTAKELQKVFETLDEMDMHEVVGFIPNVSIGMIEYDALNEVVKYLLDAELPEHTDDKLVVPDFAEKIIFNSLSKEIEVKLTTGSYQEGLLNKYFNENPGIKEVLQKKFNALYLQACEIIANSQENASDCRCYYILENSAPKRTIPIFTCIWVLMAYYFSTCDIFEEPK